VVEPDDDGVSTGTEAPHGYAPQARGDSYPAVPGEGWWNNEGIEPEWESLHPDTMLVAGWTQEIYEAYRRDPQTGVASVAPVSSFDPVPIDPRWPEAWLILDARTHEVVEVLWHPDAPRDGAPETPEGFEPLPATEAERFVALAAPIPDLTTTVLGDGHVIGVQALDPDGFGFTVRFDATDPDSWWQPDTEGEPVELAGFAAATQRGVEFTDWHFAARSDSGDCAFTISTVAPPGTYEPPVALRDHVTGALPGLVASICDEAD